MWDWAIFLGTITAVTSAIFLNTWVIPPILRFLKDKLFL